MICWSQVTELRDDVGHEDFPEVVEIFLEEVAENLASLAHDPALEEVLHALKGNALNLGFDRFATLCADAERLATAGGGDAVDLKTIRQTFDESRALFLTELPQRLADQAR
ncbi:Hpt domain-containing protein [Pseudooceanicola algae]|uniref:Uncharacterized protein n=1 Tax=Pseudooceanicola algae TaxID=1537215 RepID=A0A418SBG9_9RHOB|nr:Hpt domain-containing protein [Pseudooceanicola algae]QPM91456.1 hypothetical protein PSAL_027090 [Pseudooceanicola algae]